MPRSRFCVSSEERRRRWQSRPPAAGALLPRLRISCASHRDRQICVGCASPKPRRSPVSKKTGPHPTLKRTRSGNCKRLHIQGEARVRESGVFLAQSEVATSLELPTQVAGDIDDVLVGVGPREAAAATQDHWYVFLHAEIVRAAVNAICGKTPAQALAQLGFGAHAQAPSVVKRQYRSRYVVLELGVVGEAGVEQPAVVQCDLRTQRSVPGVLEGNIGGDSPRIGRIEADSDQAQLRPFLPAR